MSKQVSRADLLTVQQVCERAGVLASFVYDEVGAGRLTATRVGHRVFVAKQDFAKWLAQYEFRRRKPAPASQQEVSA